MKVLREFSNFVSDPWIIGGFLVVIVVALFIWAAIWRSQTNGSYKSNKEA